MIAAAGKSKYRTPEIAWWGWILIGMLIMFLGMSSAHASCMTLHEARQVWPNTYLSWHGDHCWSAHVRAAHAEMRSVPLPKPKPFRLLLEQSEQPEWIYADRWWLS